MKAYTICLKPYNLIGQSNETKLNPQIWKAKTFCHLSQKLVEISLRSFVLFLETTCSTCMPNFCSTGQFLNQLWTNKQTNKQNKKSLSFKDNDILVRFSVKISLSDTCCPNCGTQVVTLDSCKILTPKFLYRLLVSVGCRFQSKNSSLTHCVAIVAH